MDANLSTPFVMIVAIALSACATPPLTKTSSGCGLNQYDPAWQATSVREIAWTGGCDGGLASGSGKMTISKNDGTVVSYNGVMEAGMVTGQGVMRRPDGFRLEGGFVEQNFVYGKIFLPSGRLLFEGSLAYGKSDPTGHAVESKDHRYDVGTLYLNDSNNTIVLEGKFDLLSGLYAGIKIDLESGRGIIDGIVVQKGQIIKRRIDSRWVSEVDYPRAKVVADRKRQAAADVELADLQRESARRQREFDDELRRARAEDRRQAAEVIGSFASSFPTAKNAPAQRNQALAPAAAPPNTYQPTSEQFARAQDCNKQLNVSPQQQNHPEFGMPDCNKPVATAGQKPLMPIAANTSTGNTSTANFAQPALECINFFRTATGTGMFKNRCSFPVEVAWCTVGEDCRHGDWGYSSTTTLSANGGEYPASSFGQTHGAVRFGACNRKNVMVTDTSPTQFVCGK